MRRKIVCFCILLSILIMGLMGCGTETNSIEEAEIIYHEVLSNYREAKRLIYVTTIETGEEIADENGGLYLVVTDPDIKDTESIRKVLDSAFSTAYIESSLNWVLQGEYPLYKEIDGRLCTAAMLDAVGDALMEDILSVTEMTEDKIVLEVAGDLCPYEVTLIKENESWVIDKVKGII